MILVRVIPIISIFVPVYLQKISLASHALHKRYP